MPLLWTGLLVTSLRLGEVGIDVQHRSLWTGLYGEDWRFVVRGEEFVELSHSGGSTEGGARVYRVKPAKVIAFGDAHGQTTYRF